MTEEKVTLALNEEEKKKGPTSYKVRITGYALFLVLLLMAFSLGFHMHLPEDKAHELYSMYKQHVDSMLYNVSGVDDLSYRIFFNNGRLLIVCAAPIFGSLAALYTVYMTGMTLKAIEIVEAPQENVFLNMIKEPVMWLELIAISLVSIESIIVSVAMLKGKLGEEIGIYLATLMLAGSILLFSASLEAVEILGGSV